MTSKGELCQITRDVIIAFPCFGSLAHHPVKTIFYRESDLCTMGPDHSEDLFSGYLHGKDSVLRICVLLKNLIQFIPSFLDRDRNEQNCTRR